MTRHTPGNYVPLDVNYARDPDIRRAGPDAELLFVRSLAYAKSARTDGKVPAFDLEVVSVGLRNVRKSVAALAFHGLWIVTDDGWQIRSWGTWNRSVKAEAQYSETQSDKGRQGNHERWHVRQNVADPTCEWCRSSDRTGDSGSESQADRTPESPLREGKGREGKAIATLHDTSDPHDEGSTNINGTKRPVKQMTTMPGDWAPNAKHKQYAEEHKIGLAHEADQFRSNSEAKGSMYVNWDSAFRTWLGNAKKWARPVSAAREEEDVSWMR